MTTVSLRATRSFLTNDVSLDGPTLVNQGTTNTYKITDYNRFSVYTVASTLGTISISADTITLVMPSTSATQLTMSVTKDNTVSQFIVAIGATAIITPTITAPAQGATNVNLAPTLTASAFATAPAGADTHQSSQWQISTSSAFTTNVFDSGVTTVNKTSISIPAGTLAMGTLYYARVRFTGPIIGTSAWSTPTLTFTTTTQYVATPTLTMSDTVIAVTETPTLIGTAFTAVNGTDTHAATDWQVVKVSDGSVVWQSVGNTANKTTIKVPAGLLLVNTNYRARVRYAGASLGYGGWAELNFTTATQFSYGQYMLFEGNALRNGQLLVGQGGLHITGRKLNQFIDLPGQPTSPPFTTPSDPYYASRGGLSAGNEAFRPDGAYMVVAPATCRSATVYKRTGDNFDRLDLPITPDANYVNCAKWVNNDILLVGSGMNMNVYCQMGDQFVKLPNAPFTGRYDYQSEYNNWARIIVHPSGQYVSALIANAVANSSGSYSTLATWKINGSGISTTFTSLTGATINWSGYAPCAVWTPDGTRLFAGGVTVDSAIYKWENEKFTSVWAPQFPPDAHTAAFSPDATYLATQQSNEVSIYKKITGQEGYQYLKAVGSGDNGSNSSEYRASVQFTADGALFLGMTGEYADAGQTKQRLVICDATTSDFNPVPAIDFIVQNGAAKIQLYPAVPGSQ